MDFIKEGKLPEEKKAAKRIKYIFARYVTMEENLYRRGYNIPFLLCLHPYQAQAALLKIHESMCGGHPAARSLALKVRR